MPAILTTIPSVGRNQRLARPLSLRVYGSMPASETEKKAPRQAHDTVAPVKPSSGRRALPLGLAISTFSCVVLGTAFAACSEQPATWMLLWPAPAIIIFTAINFIRQGYHLRDGVFVLGKPVREEWRER